MRIPLRAGRLFRDEGEAEPVAVLSESAAQLLWPGENPLGKRLSKPVSEPPGVYWRVIGIVGDVRSRGPDRAPTPAVYRPYGQKGRSPLQPDHTSGHRTRVIGDNSSPGLWGRVDP